MKITFPEKVFSYREQSEEVVITDTEVVIRAGKVALLPVLLSQDAHPL